jgi:hypothetical protein
MSKDKIETGTYRLCEETYPLVKICTFGTHINNDIIYPQSIMVEVRGELIDFELIMDEWIATRDGASNP